MREILEDIFIWSKPSPPHGYDFNGYFLRHGSGNLVIDPVSPDADDLEFLASEGVRQILITNRNHSRAANRIRERCGAKTAIHPEDAKHARAQGCEIDADLLIGSQIGPLVVFPGAGKSPGEVVLYWRDRRLAFVGDLVIGNPPGELGTLPEDKIDDPVRLRSSVKKLRGLDLETLLVGDGVPVLENARARLQNLIGRFVD